MSTDPGPALRRPRDTGAILGDALRYYGRNFGTFLTIGATVVIPVYLIVLGLGLEQLFSGYDETPPVEHSVVEFVTAYLIVQPLITAMCAYALVAAEEDRLSGPGGPISEGLESFTPVFLAVLLAALGITLALITIVVAIYLLVRWYFVPQAVVLDRRRPADALTRSGELVRGSWWRIAGILLLAGLAIVVATVFVILPFEAAANAADSAGLSLAGAMVAATFFTPYSAIVGTLLYFDARARQEGAAVAAGAVEPPAEDGSGPPGLERPEAPIPPDRSGRPPSG